MWVRIFYTLRGEPQTVVTYKEDRQECERFIADKGGILERVVLYDPNDEQSRIS